MKPISCIIIDDDIRSIDRLQILLNDIDDIEVVAKETKPENAIAVITMHSPEMAFIDIEMPKISGLNIANEVSTKGIKTKIVFTTGHIQYAVKAIKAGGYDYILKPIDIDELKETITRYKNECRRTPESILNKSEFSVLSEREKEVLSLVFEGYKSSEIAKKLFITKATVDTHRKNILEKCGEKNLSSLIVKAYNS